MSLQINMSPITCLWTGRAFARALPDIYSNDIAFFNLVLEILLMIGGVELNPGPIDEKQCELCSTKFHTILQAVELREKELMKREKSILKKEKEADAKEKLLQKFPDKLESFEDYLIEWKKFEVKRIHMKIDEQITSLHMSMYDFESAEDDNDGIITEFEGKMLKTKLHDYYEIRASLRELDHSLLIPNQTEVEHLKAILELKRELLEAQQKSAGEIDVAMMDFEVTLQGNTEKMHCEVCTNPDKKLCEYCEVPKSDNLQNCTNRILGTNDLSSFEVTSCPVEEKEKQATKQMAKDVVEHRVLNLPPQSPSVTQIAGRLLNNTYETLKYYSPLKLYQSK